MLKVEIYDVELPNTKGLTIRIGVKVPGCQEVAVQRCLAWDWLRSDFDQMFDVVAETMKQELKNYMQGRTPGQEDAK